MTRKPKRPIRVEKSSGNVFADLGLPHPEQELLKAKLTLQIYRLIKSRGLKQAEAGKILGIKQPHVSALIAQPLRQLFRRTPYELSHRARQDVEIIVRPTRKEHGDSFRRCVKMEFSRSTASTRRRFLSEVSAPWKYSLEPILD